MLDSDLARLYGVSAKRLNEAVRRNRERFPEDFIFQLTKEEFVDLTRQINALNLRSQFATSSWGGRRYLPYAFTEQGVAMLSSVLRSKRAVQVNIEIMRAFVRLRQLMSTHKDLARKLETLEKKYDAQFKVVFDGDSPAHGTARSQETKDRLSRKGKRVKIQKARISLRR